jgi:hypothetical protein
MASMTPTSLQQAISNYERARIGVHQEKKKYDLSFPAASLGLTPTIQNTPANPEAQSLLADIGFFYASRTFHKVFTKNISIEKIKNIALISTVLTLMPDLAQKIFPGIQLTAFSSKEGLEALRTQLESREDYQAFQKKGWAEYQNLKATKNLLKQDLVSLINATGTGGSGIAQYTVDKKIIGLGKKETHQ